MNIEVIEPSVEIYTNKTTSEVMCSLESYGRTCYKSEGKICDGSAEKFIGLIMKKEHESVIEHESVTARIICDRGVTHELVRHRIGAYSQESTRYCNYSNKIQFIKPLFWEENTQRYQIWLESCKAIAKNYAELLMLGATPQEARSILPNSLKTEIVVTYNLRSWRHFFKMRCSKTAHPQMRQVANMLLDKMYNYLPLIFQDIKKWRDEQ